MSLSIFLFVYNSRVASYQKIYLLSAMKNTLKIPREFPDELASQLPKHFAMLADRGQEE